VTSETDNEHSCIIPTLTQTNTSGWLIRKRLSRQATEDLAKRRLPSKYLAVPDDNDHKREIRRLAASHALRIFPALHESIMNSSAKIAADTKLESGDSSHSLACQQLLDIQASDWPSDYYLPGLDGQLMGMVLWLTAMCYGAVHAAAWQDFFPTYAERIL
jgi:hypothetical protein